jgi:hypothetical protein
MMVYLARSSGGPLLRPLLHLHNLLALAPPGDSARRARNADAGRARRHDVAARHATAAAGADSASTASRRHAPLPNRCVAGACVSLQASHDTRARMETDME